MKIVLVIPTLKQGGAERVISELGNEFFDLGHKVELVLLAQGKDFYAMKPGIIIHRLGFQQSGILSKVLNEGKLFFRFRRLLKTLSPDAVLSFGDKYNVFTLFSSSFLGLNIYISDRSNPKKRIPKLTVLLRSVIYRKAAGIVAQTELARNILLKTTKNTNIKVIPNPVKDIEFNPDITKENIILNVGRLVPEKGQKYLIEAFSKVKNTQWSLMILGEGPLRKELEDFIVQLGISDRILLPGAVKNVDEWLGKSSIFAFPSISEGFPNALAEAMAAGLPVVSFDCDAGPRDIISHRKNGMLLPLKDVDQLAISLEELIGDQNLRSEMGLAAKELRTSLNKRKIAMEFSTFMNLK